jgi:hypothetical protein
MLYNEGIRWFGALFYGDSMREYHGHGKTGAKPPEYHVWQHMKQRCTNPDNKHYPSYGGRGITICQEWLTSFTSFLSDMGSRPSLIIPWTA